MTRKTTDSRTGRTTRVREVEGWRFTQVEQSDGTWWNIRVERVGRRVA
jgi:hypothetical protein